MFRGLKNIASDIRSEVTYTEQTVYTHTHSQSQSSTGSNSSSRTRRFIPNSLTKLSNGGSANGSSGHDSNGHGRRKPKQRVDEELDGRTEEDTVVHRALLKYFREQGKGLPQYLGGGTSGSTATSSTGTRDRTTSRFSHGSHRSHDSRGSYGSVTASPEPLQNQTYASRSTQQYQQQQQQQQQTIPSAGYNQTRSSPIMSESEDYRFTRTERPIHPQAQSHYPQQQQQQHQHQHQQRVAPLNGNSVSSSSSSAGDSSRPRLNSRFSNAGGGSISGSSRFGRRVHS